MKSQSCSDPLIIARRIRAAGRPIHIPEDDGEARYIPSGGLRIRQAGGFFESSAFDFGACTGFKILLVITNTRPTFAISRFDLELPWKESCLQWLEDPLVIDGPSKRYRFVGQGLEFDRNQVINQYANVTHIFARGESVQGFLLGWGYEAIPSDFPHGATIRAFLEVYDQYGNKFRSPVELYADRMPKRRRAPMGVRRKGGIFEKRDAL